MNIAGVDEAGKGPVIGPMCVAGVLIEESNLHLIEELGLKDSKKLTPDRRRFLDGEIKKIVDGWFVLEVSAHQIDELRTVMTMNEIMVQSFARVLEDLKPEYAILDAADVNEGRFGRNVQRSCRHHVRITSRHKADATYRIVSAASIVAKVHRDRAVDMLHKKVGDFGSGYPSDPKTIRFLREWFCEHKRFPEWVRHSWKTTRNVIAAAAQTAL